MKKILILLAIIITQFTIEAQIKTPQASPKATIDQVVGLTDVEIVYSRPLARGRAVFRRAASRPFLVRVSREHLGS